MSAGSRSRVWNQRRETNVHSSAAGIHGDEADTYGHVAVLPRTPQTFFAAGISAAQKPTSLVRITKVLGMMLSVVILAACSELMQKLRPENKGDPQAAPQRIAVLELRSQLVAADALLVPTSYFSDSIRGYIHDRVPSLSMLTKENIELLLPEKSGALADCESDCEVETGRRLGADLIVTGETLRIGGQLKLVVRMHDTRTGALIKRTEITGTGPEELRASLPAAADALISAAGLTSIGTLSKNRSEQIIAPAQLTNESARSLGTVIRFESVPAGAIVRLDEELLCAATPCQRSIVAGEHMVRMEKEGFHAAGERASLGAGTTVSLVLQPRFAVLLIETVPNGLRVLINGSPSKSTELRLDPGEYRLVADDPCYQPDGHVIVLGEGDHKRLRLAPRSRLAKVSVFVTDGAGNDIVDAEVTVGGRVMGVAPLALTVPVCTHLLTAKDPRGRTSTAPLDLHEGESREVRLLVSASTPVPDDAVPSRFQSAGYESGAMSSCRSTQNTIHQVSGWGGLATGIAGVAGFIAAFAEKQNVDSLPPGDPSISGDISTGQALNIAGGIGLGLAAIGLTTFLLSLPVQDYCGGGK